VTGPGGVATQAALPAVGICAGLSVRWLAQVLRAGGCRVHAVDCFGDGDTRAIAEHWHSLGSGEAGIQAGDVAAASAALPRDVGLWYTAGFEAQPGWLDELADGRSLIGNSAAVLRGASTPSVWFETLRACGLAAPETLLAQDGCLFPDPDPDPGPGRWLRKRGGSSGGTHVSPWRPGMTLAQGEYLQRHVAGHSLGVVFLADGGQARVLGAVRHHRLQRGLSGPFAQGALIALPGLPAELHAQIESGAARLTRLLGLVGVNGVDVVVSREGELWWLELNARLPGSLALASDAHPWPLWHWQLAGPASRSIAQLLPPLPEAASPVAGSNCAHIPNLLAASLPGGRDRVVTAQSLFRAPNDALIPADAEWPDWVHDRPLSGACILRGQPFASITASEGSAREALLTLRRRMNILAAHPAFPEAAPRAGSPGTRHAVFKETIVSSNLNSKPSINQLTAPIVEDLVRRADALRLHVSSMENGTRLIDAGQSALGGLEAGRIIGEVCMGGLGRVALRASEATPHWNWHLDVHSSNPVLACLASQYAGWSLSHGEGKGAFNAMGSGPGRALGSKEPLFEELGYRDIADTATLVLEVDSAPPVELAQRIAEMCRVAPANLTLILTPTSSLAGSVQVVSRVLEVALHKVHTLHFPLEQVIDGAASAPVCPPGADFLTAMGRTNDAILFAGQVHLFVRCEDEAAEQLALELPASASKDYGRPFAEVFKAVNFDFYKIDPLLFSPARATVTNLKTGRSFFGGRIDLGLLDQSFGIA
jgi:methenyltetrahydromethanopterin cyclohydrolase